MKRSTQGTFGFMFSLRAVACIVFVLLFGLCGVSAGAETVKIGYRAYWPLTYGTASGRPAGFVVEVFDRAAEPEGVRLEWVYDAGSAAAAVRAGRVRLWPVNPKPDADAADLFQSEPWWRAELQVVVREASAAYSPDDLRHLSLGFQNYPTPESAAERYLSGATLKRYPSPFESLEAFCRGEVDGVLISYFRAQNLLLDRPAKCRDIALRLIAIPGASTGLSILSRMEDRGLVLRLCRRIDELARDGTLADLVASYPSAASGITLHLADLQRVHLERRVLQYAFVAISIILLLSGLLWGRMTKDLSRRRRAERLLNLQNQALEQATDGIAIIGMNGRFGYANAAFSAMHGYDDGELVGKHFAILHGPEARETEMASWVAAIVNKGGHDGQIRQVRKDGTTFPLRISASLLRDESGSPAGVIVVGHDITLESRLEEQLRQAQRMEAVGRLAGGVAHDFNNYLTVILGYSELALGKSVSEATMRSSLLEIKTAGERAAELTRQLLAFGRRQMIRPMVIDFNGVVRDTENMLRRLLVSEVKVVTDLDPSLGPIKADATQLQQVLLNLAVNAQHAMPEGGILTISTRNWDQTEDTVELAAGKYSRISVSDTGSGMTPEVAEHIFEPFFTTKEQGHGSGLGLAIVYGIVKQGQGHVSVETALGEGSTFHIFWPQVEEPLGRGDTAVSQPAATGSGTVLVVDDQPDVRMLAARILRAYGYRVLEAGNYDQAEAVAAHERLDLLLTDVVLPGPNGRQVAGRLREIQPHLRVVYMSGYNEDIIARRGVLDEGVSVIQKPFKPEVLASRVGDALAQP